MHNCSRAYRCIARFVVAALSLVVSVWWLPSGGCAAGVANGDTNATGKWISKGPLLLRVYADRAAIVWETQQDIACELAYGRRGLLDKTVRCKAEPVEYELRQAKEEQDKAVAYVHKLWIDGLQPGKVYSYQLRSKLGTSEVYCFRTPLPDVKRVRFAVYGDSRSQPDVHRKIVERIAERGVDFIVVVGDLVTRGDDYAKWSSQFFEPLRGLGESVPVYAVRGNHDVGRKGYFEAFLIPPGEGYDWSVRFGPVCYLGADCYDQGVEQVLKGIERRLQPGRRCWNFVSYHEPSLNFGGHWSAWGGRKALEEFSRMGVDFVVTGHSHVYERFRPVAGPGDGRYVTYITAGGGGAPLYGIKSSPYHACAGAVYHFCLFEAIEGRLSMEAIDAEGRVFDRFEVRRVDGKLDADYVAAAVPLEEVLCYRQQVHGK